ncbi:hypothetical protein JCM14036_14720 [Desulfotomaculum defluvii]
MGRGKTIALTKGYYEVFKGAVYVPGDGFLYTLITFVGVNYITVVMLIVLRFGWVRLDSFFTYKPYSQ